jgi:murein L,D-transpeptidase YcbB/YkuD
MSMSLTIKYYYKRLNFGLIAFLLLFSVNVKADVGEAIRAQLAAHKNSLYYPASVARFYKQTGYKLLWIAPDTVKTHAWDAMMLLDCVVQYGLNHSDYHPKELLYDQLHRLIEQPDKSNIDQKALYDITLTDAILCFINNLHYGRLNPAWPPDKIDLQKDVHFSSAAILSNALIQKDFYSAITIAQPQSAGYKSLQYQMYIVTGLHTGDCYVTPASEIRMMAVNMERQRWINGSQKECIQLNRPSGILTLYLYGNSYKFKIKGSIPRNLPASLSEFSCYKGALVIGQTALKMPDQQENLKLFTTSYLNIENSAKLASLLLNRTVKRGSHQSYKLRKPLPLIVTYYTCEMQEGILLTYRDADGQDQHLEKALYALH